jgi:MHS family citrate/tricarballylate:H+ symporter-like MFS transporter
MSFDLPQTPAGHAGPGTPNAPTIASAAHARHRQVLRVMSGNLVEMFDFFLFGFYAVAIGKTFFPAGSEYASLMLTFVTFGAGFLMRPLGAVLLGSYIDRAGRRRGLILTLALMACGSILLAITPGYATIGPVAPLLVVIGRLLQGLSAGAEVGGVSVYLAEIAPPGRRGLYVSWQSASQQAAIMAAAALGFAVNTHLAKADIDAWGWRIPFGVGCLILPLLFYIRSGLEETPAFLARATRPGGRQLLASAARSWPLMLTGTMLVVMTTVSFYLITVYTPTYGKTVLHLGAGDALFVTFCVGVSNFVWLPLAGALSDRIGRAPIMVAFTLAAMLTAYPALAWLVAAPSTGRMLAVELWLSFLYASYNGATLPAIAEAVPVEVRTVGFSLVYSLATAIFGGFTPAVSTWLIERTGDKAAPGWWLAAAAACGLVGTLMFTRIAGRQPRVGAAAAQRLPEPVPE